MKLYIDHDYTSTYMLTARENGYPIELTEAEKAGYDMVITAYNAWQTKFDAACMTVHDAFKKAKQERAAEAQAMRDLNTRSNM